MAFWFSSVNLKAAETIGSSSAFPRCSEPCDKPTTNMIAISEPNGPVFQLMSLAMADLSYFHFNLLS